MSASTAHGAETPALTGQLFQIVTGYMPAVCLHAAAELKIADRLATGPKPVSELAREAQGVHEGALYRVLRGLASLGVFREVAHRTFANTSASELLRAGVRGSVRDIVLWLGNPLHLRVFAETLYSIETGATALKKVTGLEAFEYFKQNPAEDKVFNAAMTAFSAQFAPAVLEVYDFGGLGTLADIGGGHGFLLGAILQKHNGLRGIVFDLPHVVADAWPRVESLGLASRCEIASGDFFQAVPPADSYLMKSIIHDWDDARAVAILKNCAAAMRGRNGKVILLDLVVYPGNDPDMGKWIDLEMLLMAGGRERTEEEFAGLFAKAGLRLTRVVRTKSPFCVVEAVKA
jgi:hypothetical protein